MQTPQHPIPPPPNAIPFVNVLAPLWLRERNAMLQMWFGHCQAQRDTPLSPFSGLCASINIVQGCISSPGSLTSLLAHTALSLLIHLTLLLSNPQFSILSPRIPSKSLQNALLKSSYVMSIAFATSLENIPAREKRLL